MFGRQHTRTHSSVDARRRRGSKKKALASSTSSINQQANTRRSSQQGGGASSGHHVANLSDRALSFRERMERGARNAGPPKTSSPVKPQRFSVSPNKAVSGRSPTLSSSATNVNVYGTYPIDRGVPATTSAVGGRQIRGRDRSRHRRSESAHAEILQRQSAPEISVELQEDDHGMRLTHYPSSPLARSPRRRKPTSLRNTRSSRGSGGSHGKRSGRQISSLRHANKSPKVVRQKQHRRAKSWQQGEDDSSNILIQRRDDNALDIATIEQILSAKRERLAQRERELLQKQAYQTAQLEALRADALEDLGDELEMLKQRTAQVESQVRALRCPGPTPRQMITGIGRDTYVAGPSVALPPQSRKEFSSQPTASTGILRVIAARTPPPGHGSQIRSIPLEHLSRSQSPNPAQSVEVSNSGFSSAFSSFH